MLAVSIQFYLMLMLLKETASLSEKCANDVCNEWITFQGKLAQVLVARKVAKGKDRLCKDIGGRGCLSIGLSSISIKAHQLV